MNKACNAALMMPKNCVAMDMEEMRCLSGGYHLDYHWTMRNKITCKGYAKRAIEDLGLTGIQQ